jgi:gas vesicle protein
MKASTVNELKQELINLPSSQLTELCLRLARFKKENKELLTYLLFEAHDEQSYIHSVEKEIDEQFAGINQSNIYFAKKSIRKILRITNKYIRYSGSKTAETELLIHFCAAMASSNIPYQKSTALVNLYNAQLKKITVAVKALHEDLQHDYLRQLRGLL